MPIRSKAQRRYLHALLPEVAERLEAETKPGAKLPEHVGDRIMYAAMKKKGRAILKKVRAKKAAKKKAAAKKARVKRAREHADLARAQVREAKRLAREAASLKRRAKAHEKKAKELRK